MKSELSDNLAFTSGVFDLLHPAHVYFLQEFSKKSREVLTIGEKSLVKTVVAIHSDEAVSAKKGESRPVLNQEERKSVVSAVRGIDEVIIWDGWENIVELVYELKPKILAASASNIARSDWEDNWHNVAERIGARVLAIPELEGARSTSVIIKDICEKATKE
ncbi:MAG: adenylyltransferase/cytidyltransferase family protein [Candidatus Dojkabacteria bacterium]